jgi:hypothetical protein
VQGNVSQAVLDLDAALGDEIFDAMFDKDEADVSVAAASTQPPAKMQASLLGQQLEGCGMSGALGHHCPTSTGQFSTIGCAM